jgi:hypothetical protein
MLSPDMINLIANFSLLQGRLRGLTPEMVADDILDLHRMMESIRRDHGSVEAFLIKMDQVPRT